MRTMLPWLLLLALVAGGAPAAQAAGWAAPVTLEAGEYVGLPGVAVDDRGRAGVAWANDASVRVAIAERGRPFREVSTVRLRRGQPIEPHVALARGRAVVVWTTFAGDGENEWLDSGVVGASGFRALRRLTNVTQRLGDLALRAAPGGEVLAGWQEQGTARVALSPRAQRFGAPAAASDDRSFQVTFGFGDRGETVAVWNVGHSGTILSSYRAPGGVFERPQRVSAPGGYSREPSVAVAPDGAVVAAWSQSGSGGYTIRTAVRPAGAARFDEPQAVDGPGGSRPDVAASAAGAVVAYTARTGVVAAARAPGASAFAPARAVRGSSGVAFDTGPQVEADRRGGFVAAWTTGETAMVAERRGGAFGAARRVSATREGGVAEIRLAVGARGDAIVGWAGDNRENARVVRRSAGG